MQKTVIAIFILLAGFAASFGPALSHSGASGVVKERMDAMKAIGGHMKIVADMLRKLQPFDAEAAKQAANGIAEHAARIPDMFPDGTAHKPSEALPAIWSDWDAFSRQAEALEERAQLLASTSAEAASTGEIAGPFRQVAETCSACHERFRAEN